LTSPAKRLESFFTVEALCMAIDFQVVVSEAKREGYAVIGTERCEGARIFAAVVVCDGPHRPSISVVRLFAHRGS